LLDDGGFEAELRSAASGNEAGKPAADGDQIVLQGILRGCSSIQAFESGRFAR
jgi:hypothetical protein